MALLFCSDRMERKGAKAWIVLAVLWSYSAGAVAATRRAECALPKAEKGDCRGMKGRTLLCTDRC